MDNISKKVGFLKGLMEGMDFDAESPNGKLLAGVVELLGDLVERVEVIDEVLDDLNDYVESIDDDLSVLEDGGEREGDFPFGVNDEEDDDFDDFDDAEDHLHLLAPELPDEPDAELMEAPLSAGLCPVCGRLFFVPLNDPEDTKYLCPHCAAPVIPSPLTPENAPIASKLSLDP